MHFFQVLTVSYRQHSALSIERFLIRAFCKCLKYSSRRHFLERLQKSEVTPVNFFFFFFFFLEARRPLPDRNGMWHFAGRPSRQLSTRTPEASRGRGCARAASPDGCAPARRRLRGRGAGGGGGLPPVPPSLLPSRGAPRSARSRVRGGRPPPGGGDPPGRRRAPNFQVLRQLLPRLQARSRPLLPLSPPPPLYSLPPPPRHCGRRVCRGEMLPMGRADPSPGRVSPGAG